MKRGAHPDLLDVSAERNDDGPTHPDLLSGNVSSIEARVHLRLSGLVGPDSTPGV
jgi:hypothetical protein